MSVLIPELTIGDEVGADSCSGTSKGWVITVDKCTDHNHYIDITSLGTYVLSVATTMTETVVGARTVTVGGQFSLSANAGSMQFGGSLIISSDADIQVQSDTSVAISAITGISLLVAGNGIHIDAAGSVTIDSLSISYGGGGSTLSAAMADIEARLAALEAAIP